MAVTILPPGPDVPTELQELMQSWYAALQELQNPGAPVQLPEIDTAANLLLKAPADRYPNCAIVVTDKTCIAVSTDVAGTWTWLRADGNAL